MKLLILCTLLLLPLTRPALAQIIYSGEVNIPVPMNYEGLYLNPYTGDTSLIPPSAWDSAPWINAFWGGNAVATSSLLMPVISAPATGLGDGRLIRLVEGDIIDGTRDYSLGDNGSDTHTGSAIDEFLLDAPGFLGFKMLTSEGEFCFGWIEITVKNDSSGTIHSWAWESSGAPIAAGLFSIPEPGAASFLMASTLLVACRRRRGSV